MPPQLKILIPVVIAICSTLVLWKVGYDVMLKRMIIDINGQVVHSVDVPETGAPGYATAYVFQSEDGSVKEYVATDDKASLERSMPVNTVVVKKKWDFGYLKDAKWIRFISPIYPISVVVSAVGLIGSLLALLHLWQDKRAKESEAMTGKF